MSRDGNDNPGPSFLLVYTLSSRTSKVEETEDTRF